MENLYHKHKFPRQNKQNHPLLSEKTITIKKKTILNEIPLIRWRSMKTQKWPGYTTINNRVMHIVLDAMIPFLENPKSKQHPNCYHNCDQTHTKHTHSTPTTTHVYFYVDLMMRSFVFYYYYIYERGREGELL